MKEEKNNKPGKNAPSSKKHLDRREVLKSLATLPFAGALMYGAFRKKQYEHYKHNKILRTLSLDSSSESPVYISESNSDVSVLGIGIIGTGIRGGQLMRAAGFIHSSEIDEWREEKRENRQDNRLDIYLEQEDLKLRINGVCDVFTIHEQKALDASANLYRTGKNGKKARPAKAYKDYRDLLKADDIDAVIIATPDHWHAQMIIDAANAGKHIYAEKPLSLTVEETFAIEKAVRENNVVFQLGHQNRQIESHQKAKEVIRKNILGKITLIETFTNRNSPDGAWVYDIHPDASPKTIDWQKFLGRAPSHSFSAERFFRWRCWWDYSTGLTGDLFTHEYDSVNQVMNLGIPDSATATGGIYFFKDGRTVPDVMHVSFEFAKYDLNLLYSATLANSKHRKKSFYGHDGFMELDQNLVVYSDRESTKYEEAIEDGIIPTESPMITHIPGESDIDAITSATQQYFASRGLLFTYRGGRQVDTTHLHLKEWTNAIRHGGAVSCGIKEGVEEAITAHMGTIAYRKGKKVFWDTDKKQVITS